MCVILKALVLFGLSSSAFSSKIIESPKVSNFGNWGIWDRCPNGEYAVGFQLRTESWLGPLLDDTSLNAIRLLCEKPGDEASSRSYAITSSVGQFGKYGTTFNCQGVMNGFQLKSEIPKQVDNSASNNLRVFCSANKNFIEGDGERWGDWTLSQHCETQQAICAIQVQLQAFQGPRSDDTSLNNIRMECCDVENPGSLCKPSDKLKFLIRCDNSQGSSPINCVFHYNLGLSYSVEDSYSEAYESIGYNLENIGDELRNNYVTNYGVSPITGYSWKDASAKIWEPESKNQGNLEVSAGSISDIYQISGECGFYAAGTDKFKQILSDKKDATIERIFTV